MLLRHLLAQNSTGSCMRPVTLSFAGGAGINAHYPSSVVQSLLNRLKLILLNNVQTPVQPALTLHPANSTSGGNASSSNSSSTCSSSGKAQSSTTATPFSHFQSQQSQTRSFLFNLFNVNTTFPFLLSLGTNTSSSVTSSATTLHLITAYSGYSKDYLNNTFNANIKRTDCLQHQRGKKKKGGVIGDDAWFITRQPAVDVLGVADGVGGWHSYGIDPSKFSFSLMKTCKRIVEQDFDIPTQSKPATKASNTSRRTGSTMTTSTTTTSQQRPQRRRGATANSSSNYKYCEVNTTTPLNLLEESYRTLLENKNSNLLVGSSTACILIFHHETSLLHSCNLGDSGFVIIRDDHIIHRSQEQQHYFNSPYQIAILPNLQRLGGGDNEQAEEVLVVNNNNNSQESSLINDSPEAATSSTVELKEGDFIVVGTDGLWDNLTESHLLIEIAQIKVSKIVSKIE